MYCFLNKARFDFFGTNSLIQRWENTKNLRASKLLKTKEYDSDDHLTPYLQKLQNITKLKPRGGFFREDETVKEYMARALQKATQMGKLDQVTLK